MLVLLEADEVLLHRTTFYYILYDILQHFTTRYQMLLPTLHGNTVMNSMRKHGLALAWARTTLFLLY